MVLFNIVLYFALPQSYRPVFTDGFETFVALVSAVACGFAAVRSSNSIRGLWVLTTAHLALLALADSHDFLHGIHPAESTLYFVAELLGWYAFLPLLLLVFFPVSEESRLKWKWLPVLDFVQLSLVM